ncbi:energy-coupling factor transporter transmembrane component T [Sporosarcina sp. G11-34]|uniref:energy-coupling factor transporter transmembrane component T n=1 Tax=Sporosarcina sp. G11-34 TaxID=2849605 RepID=UPI0022A90A5F|nr:energy-coupling factor transporter transmembrane component T [Sporosarcina sp. G11-34]MCZ2260683.1 energy-coupling factor transporter transmembrane protein EcfT [Sporosarcina sp. G11-34]
MSYYIAVGVLLLYFNHPLFLLLIFLFLIALNLTHDRGKEMKKWLPLLLIMSSIIVMLNPFLVSRGTTILFYFRGKQVTVEASVYGVVMSLSIVGIIILFISFNLILNGNKFLYIFSRVLPKLAFLSMLAIRFVPLLRVRLGEITDVQRIRGIDMRSGSIWNRAKSGMILLQILLTWSLEEALETANSMEARGYGIGKRSSYLPFQWERRDVGWLLIIWLLFIACLLGGVLGYGKIFIYPELGTLQFYALDWVLLGCLLILVAFPLLVEGREQMRWKLSR